MLCCLFVKTRAINHQSKFRFFKTLPKGVFAISLFGLFLGAASTMIYSQLPMFMKHELHASALKIALIDGIVEFLSFLIRIFSGAASDYLSNRKLFLLLGCTISLFVKPMLAFAKSSLIVMLAQAVERIGNGLQASPRDALIADLSDKNTSSQSFGFSRSLKTIGALLGSPIAIALMYFTNNNYRLVFFCASIPVIMAIICLHRLKVKQNNISINTNANKIIKKQKQFNNPFKKQHLKSMDSAFWKLLLLAALFELGHFTEHLLAIRTNDFIGKGYAGSVAMFVCIGQILCSYPIGLYADKIGKKIFIQLCMVMMIAANISMIYATTVYTVFFGAFLWGGQMTAVQGLFLSIISDRVDHRLIGTAIGLYYIAIGTSGLVASTVAGHLWGSHGSNFAFMYSIICVLLSLSLFSFLFPKKASNFAQSRQ